MVSAKRAPWSLESLERACRKALPSATLRLANLPNEFCADVVLGDRPKIRVDSHQIGVRTAVIHELLHVVLDEDLIRFEPVEEVLIEALEAAVNKRISGSRRRVAWWRNAIDRKLRIRK